eukprot:1270904-Prymnesium_polylepis.1
MTSATVTRRTATRMSRIVTRTSWTATRTTPTSAGTRVHHDVGRILRCAGRRSGRGRTARGPSEGPIWGPLTALPSMRLGRHTGRRRRHRQARREHRPQA